MNVLRICILMVCALQLYISAEVSFLFLFLVFFIIHCQHGFAYAHSVCKTMREQKKMADSFPSELWSSD